MNKIEVGQVYKSDLDGDIIEVSNTEPCRIKILEDSRDAWKSFHSSDFQHFHSSSHLYSLLTYRHYKLIPAYNTPLWKLLNL